MSFFSKDNDLFRSGTPSYHLFRRKESTLDWVESVSPGEESRWGGGSRAHFVTSSLQLRVCFFLGLLFFLSFTLALFRVAHLQLAVGDEYRTRALGNSQRIIPVPSERGLIYDREGRVLTQNVPKFSLVVVPQDIPNVKTKKTEYEAFLASLSEVTNISKEEIVNELNTFAPYRRDSIVMKEDLEYEEALRMEIAAVNLPGVRVEQGSKRLYLTSTSSTSSTPTLSFSHVLGYVGKLSPEELESRYEKGYVPSDDIGKTGVEKQYEEALRGTYGNRRIEVDARGREQDVIAENEPTPGNHVKVSIDAVLQHAIEEILTNRLKDGSSKKASVVVIDPRNGEILSLVSTPAFDNNDFSGGISIEQYQAYISDPDRPLFHRAISGAYPSGSTLKPAIAAVALDAGILNRSTSFISSGGIQVGPWFFPDWQAGGHGVTNVTRAIAWSVNTFFYTIGGGNGDFDGLGITKIREGLLRFGFAEKTNVDLPGEVGGFLPSPEWKKEKKGEQWYIGDTYNVSIGQGDVLVTPLQIAATTASIANGGTLYEPHVLRSMINPETKEERLFSAKILKENVAGDTSLAIVRDGMRECVTYGACRLHSLLPFTSAGKTGTAQWSATKNDHAWYTSFAPFESPEIVVTVLVEEGGGGSAVAAPIAYDIYRFWWQYTRR